MSKFICSCGCATDNDQSIIFKNGYRLEIHRCDACQKRHIQEIEWQIRGETYKEDKIICPYCEYEYDIEDACYFEDVDHDAVECLCCGKHFDLEVRVVWQYSTQRSLCDMPDDFDPEDDDE